MARRLGHYLRKWYVIGASIADIPPTPPVDSYYPKLDFTDARNSMYSMGGF